MRKSIIAVLLTTVSIFLYHTARLLYHSSTSIAAYPHQRIATSGIADAVCDPSSGLCTTLRPAYSERSLDTVDYFSNRRLIHTLRESPPPRRALLSACPSFDMLYDPYRLSFLLPVLIPASSSCSWTPNQNDPKPAMQTCHRPDSSPHRDR